MSFTDRLLLWFHIGFVIFSIGPVTIATMSTPRYIRKGNVAVLRYLARTTKVFTAISLGVLLFGIILGQARSDMAKVWVTVSMTLFVVALVLLVLIIRDQHRAISALETAAEGVLAGIPGTGTIPQQASAPPGGTQPLGGTVPDGPGTDTGEAAESAGPPPARHAAPDTSIAAQRAATAVAGVERGRIASMAGVVSLIWLVILVLMIWR